MSNIILVILLILALCLIVTVLLQRSEGGGLGIGGGGGGNGTGGRPPASPVAKLTWFFGAGFMAACLALTVISARDAANDSLLTGDLTAPVAQEAEDTTSPLGGNLLPPTAEDQPATPPTAED